MKQKVFQEKYSFESPPAVKSKVVSSPPPTEESTVFISLMNHDDMKAGWRFAEPSWAVRVDGVVKGIFPDPRGREEAEKLAGTLATKLGRTVHVVE